MSVVLWRNDNRDDPRATSVAPYIWRALEGSGWLWRAAMDELALISVIICARNEEEHIGVQLAALADQTASACWEVLVVDNGSTDRTVARAREFETRLPKLTIVDASGRAGVCFARNRGAAAARGDYLLFVDGDDEVQPGWLTHMAQAASRFDAVCGNLRRFREEDDGVKVFAPDVHRHLPTHGYRFLPSFFGGNFGIRRDVFQDLGGFDERYDVVRSGDDVELSWRLVLGGYTLGFAPDAVVSYRSRETLRDLFKQSHRDSRAAPYLYREFRRSGMPRSSTSEALRWWITFPLRIVRERGIESRGNLACEFGWRTGRIDGGLRARALYL
jgi:glycosyltransferase involved in cell wall biosynthesis